MTHWLDPLSPTPPGSWCAYGVRVARRVGRHRGSCGEHSLCTDRFCARRSGGQLTVLHDLSPDELCDELAVLLADELDAPGTLLRGQRDFELVFTGIVRSTVDGALPSWLRFYRNSIDRLADGTASFGPVHDHAAAMLVGHQLIDLGSCFGFFALRAVDLGMDVTATDLSHPTMDLLARVSALLHRQLRIIGCDAAHVPLPDGSADTVTALHLLEHLTPAAAGDVLEEAIRLARRRVIVAVPFEDQPRACYGHVQAFSRESLRRLGSELSERHLGLIATVDEHRGGWLILDRTI
ncbi:methylase involved in ubiquinone/menaquinone biosynthesis (plasmid) [Mycolicibacterium chubuense NBB4]|uniref:Methylase involved in ubiquinone/menaquinone biosynthesis n=2 Tax=Mycolicibacterium TaxID=1866885 RepID=I4BT86_MYCCN|nr:MULTISPECIES: mycofactocin oligosaccharide methyltransferase MftM [Mycolicibacterium]AFM20493.1 methylase involved in ubiquinone/menaquinone biosynthesis [Mycolicibacterium chubuense NBB4]NTY63960.1 class I SAM-dependent methyltransferase [Mycolicibacterium sphagni]